MEQPAPSARAQETEREADLRQLADVDLSPVVDRCVTPRPGLFLTIGSTHAHPF